jgi:hypothetical protein
MLPGRCVSETRSSAGESADFLGHFEGSDPLVLYLGLVIPR